jgi:hypothetical protein
MAPHSERWFKDTFTVEEPPPTSMGDVFSVEYDAEGAATLNISGKKRFYIGKFSTPTVTELRASLSSNITTSKETTGATFSNVSGNVCSFHSSSSPVSPGSTPTCVIQAASQMNCLEMVGPGVAPDSGVTGYFRDRTQGPACALTCPAGTLFRNYFVQTTDPSTGRQFVGQCRGGRQINLASSVEEVLENEKHGYWALRNGYLLPAKGKMAKLNQAMEEGGEELCERVVDSFGVGVHWGTEVGGGGGGGGGIVCQVYASAVPVAYCKSTSITDWAPFARLTLRGMYKATLLVGAKLARESGERVTVYLTMLGGGAFGNQITWVLDAIEEAFCEFGGEALDVKLGECKKKRSRGGEASKASALNEAYSHAKRVAVSRGIPVPPPYPPPYQSTTAQ